MTFLWREEGRCRLAEEEEQVQPDLGLLQQETGEAPGEEKSKEAREGSCHLVAERTGTARFEKKKKGPGLSGWGIYDQRHYKSLEEGWVVKRIRQGRNASVIKYVILMHCGKLTITSNGLIKNVIYGLSRVHLLSKERKDTSLCRDKYIFVNLLLSADLPVPSG